MASPLAQFKLLPKSTKVLFSVGMLVGFLIALPLFVYMVTTQIMDLRNHAAESTPTPTPSPSTTPTITPTSTPSPTPTDNPPNGCGGTCGSNYNCEGNLYCYTGYCRNPFCKSQTNCICPTATPSATPTPKVTPTSKVKASISPTFSPLPSETPVQESTPPALTFTLNQNPTTDIPLLVKIAIGGIALSLILIIIGIKKR